MHQNDNLSSNEIERLIEVAQAELVRQCEYNLTEFHGEWVRVDGSFNLRALVEVIAVALQRENDT